MKKFQNQLKTISKTLTKLSAQVEKISAQMEAAKPAAKPAKKAKAAPAKAKAKAKKVVKKAAKTAKSAKPVTVLENVFDVIKKNKNGANIDKLKQQTKLQPRQLSNALYKLTKKGMIEAKSRGVYFVKK